MSSVPRGCDLGKNAFSNEGGNDAVRHAHDVIQRWNNRITLRDLRLGERYLKGQLVFHVHLTHGTDGGHPEYCALFQRIKENPVRTSIGHLYGEVPETGRAQNHCLVFVESVESSQNPQRVSVPSLVWFDTSENVHRSLNPALLLGLESGFKRFGRFTERKMFSVWIGPSMQVEPRVLQRSSTAVDDFAKHDTPYSGDRFQNTHDIVGPPVLHVTINGGAIRATVVKGTNPFFKVREVFFGPFNLEPGAGRLIGHGD